MRSRTDGPDPRPRALPPDRAAPVRVPPPPPPAPPPPSWNARDARSTPPARRWRPPSWMFGMAALAGLLVVALGVAALSKLLSGTPILPPTGTTAPTASPTPSPTPTPAPWLNPILVPATLPPLQETGTIAADALPSATNLTYDLFDVNGRIDSYVRPYAIAFGDPSLFNRVMGVLTFRGNNFRSSGAFGLVSLTERKMAQVWERPVGSLKSSQWSFSWTGTGWTGQPLIVQWPEETRAKMNLKEAKKGKVGLKECISATMDGHIYFYDLDDGVSTRDPIDIGAPIKGTPCVDPRGYPLLYVGQGDMPPPGTALRQIGWRIYSLIDGKLLFFQNGIDGRAYRTEWGACDSSPIVDPDTDTLIWPSENGLFYTYRLHTDYDAAKGTIAIHPEAVTYRFKSDATKMQGVESSVAVYNHYAYYSDNSGILSCLDLQTMTPVWSLPLADDSDVTATLDAADGTLALYTGTEVDWQKDIVGNYLGEAYVYRIDPLTGTVAWRTSVPCWTKNAANVGDDVNGGCLGSPVVGKKKMSNLVVFSFCMTNGIYSGDSLVAFEKATGKVVWTYRMTHYSWSSPVDVYDADGNPYIVICDSAGQIHLVDGLTGEAVAVLQTYKNLGTDQQVSAKNIESSPAIFGNQLVVGTRGNVIVGVTLK